MAKDMKKRWFRLDTAAKLYPAIATSRWSSVFRLSLLMKSPIKPDALQAALQSTLPRFPTLAVRMRRGFFWYYFEANDRPLAIRPDEGHPCMNFRFHENGGYLFRVLYGKKRLSVEFFHSLTDGAGGLVFLKTLAAEYLRQVGIRIPTGDGVLDIKRKPSQGEMENAFRKAPLPHVKLPRKEKPAFMIPGDLEPPHTLHIVAATMPISSVKGLAGALGVTVTEYLAAVLLYVCYERQKTLGKRPRPLRVSVPVNMRAYYPTESLRNFSSFINPEIDPRLGPYTFPEIAREVHAFMAIHRTEKRLFAGIATHVADEKNLLLRLFPLPLKNMAIYAVFKRAGERALTTTLSNLGPFMAPPQLMAHVERAEALLGPASTPCCNCTLTATGDTLLWMFSRNMKEADLPRGALRFLVEQGVPITVESNQL